ncbi:MAG TPA: hypothetical protein VGS41_09595, partial [Chthonomonadales bacterium]|nr:hypothetical protein [Chthonomonadales bacterium]
MTNSAATYRRDRAETHAHGRAASPDGDHLAWRVASMIPGRLRLQSVCQPAPGALEEVASEIGMLADVLRSVAIPDAYSVLVIYRAERISTNAILRAAFAKIQEWQMRCETASRSTGAGRIKRRGSDKPGQAAPAIAGGVQSRAAIVSQRRDEKSQTRVRPLLPEESGHSASSPRRHNRSNEAITARNMPGGSKRARQALVVATAALGVSFFQTSPALIVSGLLAAATVPVLMRAVRGLQRRQITVD